MGWRTGGLRSISACVGVRARLRPRKSNTARRPSRLRFIASGKASQAAAALANSVSPSGSPCSSGISMAYRLHEGAARRAALRRAPGADPARRLRQPDRQRLHPKGRAARGTAHERRYRLVPRREPVLEVRAGHVPGRAGLLARLPAVEEHRVIGRRGSGTTSPSKTVSTLWQSRLANSLGDALKLLAESWMVGGGRSFLDQLLHGKS